MVAFRLVERSLPQLLERIDVPFETPALKLLAGDIEDAKVYVTFYKQGDVLDHPNYANGETVKFAVANGGVKAEVDGEVKRISVCAKCLRDGKVKRA